MVLKKLTNNTLFLKWTFPVLSLQIMLFLTFLLPQITIAQSSKTKDKFLEGKIYLIELVEKGSKKTKSTEDELSFKSGKFKSKTMFEEDFGPANYTVSVDSSSSEGKIISFEAQSKNKENKEETLTWKGTIEDDNIEGSAIWIKKGKTKKEFEFSGSLKRKKK